MRRLLLVTTILAFLFASKTASAQSTLTLGIQTSGTVTFTSESGGVVDMTVSSAEGGAALGTGILLHGTSYTLVSGTVALTPIGAPGGAYSASGTFSFELNNGTLLTGTLSLGSVAQAGGGLLTFGTGNLVITSIDGVSCVPTCPGPGDVSLVIKLASTAPLHTESGSILSGSVSISPEPSSMLLFGTGLLACGVFLRRRLA